MSAIGTKRRSTRGASRVNLRLPARLALLLYRGAGFAVVWPQFVIVALIGGLFLGLALRRFRRVTGAVA
jgi:hypothetical protein